MLGIKRRKRNIQIGVAREIHNFSVGIHRSLLFGRGGDFYGVRDWQPGDRHLSIPATIRTSKPMFKVFEEPKSLKVWLLIDNSPSMNFGSEQKKIDIACALCLLFGFSVDSVGDRLSVSVFGSDQPFFTELGLGNDNALTAIDFALSKKHKDGYHTVSISDSLSLITAREPTNSLVIIISDFCFNLPLSAKNHIGHIGSLRNTVLLSIIIGDRQEDDLPKAPLMANVFDSETKKYFPIDLRSAHYEKSSLDEELRSLNSYVARVDASDKCFKQLVKFFSSLLLCK